MHKKNLVTLLIITLLLLFVGCQSTKQLTTPSYLSNVQGVEQLLLTAQDQSQLGLITNETSCTVDSYVTSESSPLGQYSMCTFYVNNLSGSQIIIELSRFADYGNLNGSFQYNSGHLQGAKGIISLNTFGDQSRFSKNSDDDYGAEFNKDNTSYYHLWFTKDLYMVHVTSKGVVEDKEFVQKTGEQILSKFD